MFKLSKSLNKTQQNILTVILILLDLFIIIFWINFGVGLKKITPSKIVEKPTSEIEEIPEELKPGEVGEPKEGEKPSVELPPVISNTLGTVQEIKTDRLIVSGNGSNFSDQKARELTLILTELTTTFELGQKIEHKGFEGLKHLKIGDEISIASPENIRGKTEFTVDYINKLNP